MTFNTLRSKAGRLSLSVPSLTVITIPLVEPTSLFVGTPDNIPVVSSKFAHVGLFTMVKVNSSSLKSLAVGVKL